MFEMFLEQQVSKLIFFFFEMYVQKKSGRITVNNNKIMANTPKQSICQTTLPIFSNKTKKKRRAPTCTTDNATCIGRTFVVRIKPKNRDS